jgi:hypothetical protein
MFATKQQRNNYKKISYRKIVTQLIEEKTGMVRQEELDRIANEGKGVIPLRVLQSQEIRWRKRLSRLKKRFAELAKKKSKKRSHK